MTPIADRSGFRRACASLAFAIPVALAGCGGSGASPSASEAPSASTGAVASASVGLSSSPTTGESALPVVSGSALPSAPPSAIASAVGSLYVRTWFENPSLGPDNFWFTPTVVSNGKLYYQPEATTESPAKLLRAPLAVPISQGGINAIAAEAQHDGLLGATQSFECAHTPGAGHPAGTGLTHLQIVLNGVPHNLSGGCPYMPDDEITPGPSGPASGTYYAFMDFVAHLKNMSGWLGGALGTPAAWDPARLVVVASLPDDAWWSPAVNPADTTPWLVGDKIFDHFGTPFDPTAEVPGAERCGIVTGADLVAQLPSIKTAHEGTLLVDSKSPTHEKRVLAVRPLFPDEVWTGCGS